MPFGQNLGISYGGTETFRLDALEEGGALSPKVPLPEEGLQAPVQRGDQRDRLHGLGLGWESKDQEVYVWSSGQAWITHCPDQSSKSEGRGAQQHGS